MFNALGQPYEYEKEGYVLQDGEWYLCDFWLPKDEAWIEVKGKYPTPREIRRLAFLASATPCKSAYIFYGPIPNPKSWRTSWTAVSVLPTSQPLFRTCSDARISAAFRRGRSTRFTR